MMNTNRDFIKLAGLGMAALSFPMSGNAAEARHPNIVFILSDDHAPQAIGAYDLRLSAFCRENNITPNIDRLAAEGMLFQNSFCANSICSPSRAAILTGLHGHASGVRCLNQGVAAGIWKFPEAFRAAGYQSAVIGKWHLEKTTSETDYWCLLRGQGEYVNPKFDSTTGSVSRAGYVADVITDLSLEWLDQRDPAKPFLLMLHQKPPHRDWTPPERYAALLDGVTVPEPDTLFDNYANRASPLKQQKLTVAKHMNLPGDFKIWPAKPIGQIPEMYRTRNAEFRKLNPQGDDLTRWKYQTYVKDYLRCVKSVDDGVGRVLDYLEKNGLEKNTVVIYSSDQGFYLGEHGWFDKRWIFEESIHMPFIIRWPGVVKPGSRPDAMIQNIDYAPTLAEVAGEKIPSGLHGRSLLPILRGETPADWRTSIYYRYYDPGWGIPQHNGVRTKNYTLVHYFESNEWDLFDLKKDPGQMQSVYANPEYADIVQNLKTEIETLRRQYGETDPAPYSEPQRKSKE